MDTRIKIVLLLMVPLVLLCTVTVTAAPVLREDFKEKAPNELKSGGILGDKGWKSTRGVTSEIGDFFYLSGTTLPAERGSLEFILTNSGENNDEVQWETIFAVEDLDMAGDFYPFPLNIMVQWVSQMDPKRSGLNIDTAKGSDPGRNIWGEYVVFDRKFQQGEKVHLVLTWGPNGPEDNKVVANGVEAVGYYRGSGEQSLSRDAKMVEVLPPEYKIKVGDAYQTHLNGSWLERLAIYDTILEPPTIASVSHDAFSVAGYSGKLVAGDVYHVTLKAEPDGEASFDLGSVKGHPMTESSNNPGTYTGVHIIRSGEDVEEGQLVGHFKAYGFSATPAIASRLVTIDTRVYMEVKTSNDLIPADEDSKAGITIVARDANGKAVKDHELKFTLSTTDEYTGTVGGGTFEDLVGGELDVDWGGITDSFGEVTAQYLSGFAAKTILVSAKDMLTGDVGVGWVRSYIDGEVYIIVTEPVAAALSVAGSLDVSLSRDWLTADGKSRSRMTAVIKDSSGKALSGHNVKFSLLGENGEIRIVQSKTDSRGRAFADYIAGTIMGQVQVEVRDLTSGMVVLVPIELRPDAPAEIVLAADPAEVVTGGESTVSARVTDANGNPNQNVDVIYNILVGNGELSSPSVGTDEKGNAPVVFTAGDSPGLVTVKGSVISREPTALEISAAEGAVFLFGLEEDPGRLDVFEWLVEPGDEVVEGQQLLTLEDRRDNLYTVVAPRDGIVSTFVVEERDRAEYGDTLGYVIEIPE